MHLNPTIADSGSAAAVINQLAARSLSRPVWVRVGQLIDGESDQPIRDANVVFDAKRIYAIAEGVAMPAAEHLRADQDEPDAVLSDFTVLPCLIEAHAHLFLEGAPVDGHSRADYLKQSRKQMLTGARERIAMLLQFGVGTVRDAGDKHSVGLALAADAKRQQAGLAEHPWIDSPGAAIHHRGRYGSFMGEPLEEYATPADCVAARVEQGADRIKLLVSGIINFKAGCVTNSPQMCAEEVSALVKASEALGRQTFAHASGEAGVENSIAGGVTTIEHGFFCTRDQLAQMRARNIAWVPTFAPVQAQLDHADSVGWGSEVVAHLSRILDQHRKALRLAHDMGVTVIAGSDAGSCGVPHGKGLLDELHYMEQGGMPAMDVLKSATGTSAARLNFAEPVGRIAAGCRSRLIFTKHDPLATVANLQKDKIIVFDGNVLHVGQTVSIARM